MVVISRSISIDPKRYERVESLLNLRHWRLEMDPNGYFAFSAENNQIVARQYDNTTHELLAEYSGGTAEKVELAIVKDGAISIVSHAIYIGMRLKEIEQRLKNGPKLLSKGP